MRVVTLLLCCITNIIAQKILPLNIRQEWLRVAEPHNSHCISLTGVDPVVAYNALMKTELSNDSGLKCYINCIQQKLNLMDSIGEFVEEEFVRQMAGATPAITKKCIEQTNNDVDLCKKGFDMFLCLVHELAKPYGGTF